MMGISVFLCHPRTALLLSLSAQFVAQIRRRDIMVVSAAIFFLSAWAATQPWHWHGGVYSWENTRKGGYISHTHMITDVGMYRYLYIYIYKPFPLRLNDTPTLPFLKNTWNIFIAKDLKSFAGYSTSTTPQQTEILLCQQGGVRAALWFRSFPPNAWI